MRALARSVWITFRRGGGFPFALSLLFGIGALFWVILQVQGTFIVNGAPALLDDDARISLALGVAVRAVNFLVTLFLLFQGAGLLLGDVESGRAVFDLTAPVSRARYLAGRILGVFLLAFLLTAIPIAAFESILLVRFGSPRAGLLAAGLILLLGQALFAGVLVMLRLLLGAGWGAMGALLVWLGSGLLSLDIVESYLFAVTVPEGASPWWLPMLRPVLGGEPIGPKAELARAVVRFFPPIANTESVAVDLAAGKPVFPSLDWWSLPIAAAWGALFWFLALHLFRRRDA
jgi:ABC-type transport system involved in multi-copper enzyme maturation permease subunit